MNLLLENLIALYHLLNGSRVEDENSVVEMRQKDLSEFLDLTIPKRILDIANGRLRPQYTLLKAQGHFVVGIDIENRTQPGWGEIQYRIARWLYGIYAGIDPESQKTLVCGNVETLPFLDCSFDLITSVAAFEHFLSVPSVVSEIYRVLRPGGLAWVSIHPFTCPTGGHNVKLMETPLRSIPSGVDAWDHLRKRRIPFHVPLNEWRPSQYLKAFSRNFEIVKDYVSLREGDLFLTPEIQKELVAYTHDELTTGTLIIVAKKSSSKK